MSRDPILDRIFSQRLAVKNIAAKAGISTAAVCQWRRVPKAHVQAVSEVSGIPPCEIRADLYPPTDVSSRATEPQAAA